MTDAPVNAGDGADEQQSFWASFNRDDDAKLFLVTFAGTVAANIVTVLIGAAACHVPLHAGVYERCLYGRIPRKEHPLLMGLPAWVWKARFR
jgi:hypothetical protein